MSPVEAGPAVEIHPVTSERWGDLEALFGKSGACAGCWCMFWRLGAAQFKSQKGVGNREALRGLVEEDAVPGLLAYVAGEPAGWISLSPREQYSRLERSRVLKPVDEEPVWSVVCFFVAKRFRRQGLSVRLLRAGVEHAARHGARIVEGYPVEPGEEDAPPVFVYTGLPEAYRRAGFTEVLRRSPSRPIFRHAIGQ